MRLTAGNENSKTEESLFQKAWIRGTQFKTRNQTQKTTMFSSNYSVNYSIKKLLKILILKKSYASFFSK